MDKVHLIATDSAQPDKVENVNTVEFTPTKPMKRNRKKTGCLITMLIVTALLLAATITFGVLVSNSWATYAAFDRYDYGYDHSYMINEITQEIKNLQNKRNNDLTLNNIYTQLSSKLNKGSYCSTSKSVEDQLLQSYQWNSLAKNIFSQCVFEDYINAECIQDNFMSQYNSNDL